MNAQDVIMWAVAVFTVIACFCFSVAIIRSTFTRRKRTTDHHVMGGKRD